MIGLQDVCIGQTSGDGLSRDKQVSGFRRYGPDKCLELPLDYSVQRPNDSQQSKCPVFYMLLLSTGADLGQAGADLKKNLTAAKGCGPKVNGQKGRGQKPFAHAQCKVVE